MAEYYKLLSPMIDPCHARWINYQDVYTGASLLGVCMAAYGKQSSASADSCAGGTASYGSGTSSDLSVRVTRSNSRAEHMRWSALLTCRVCSSA
jgi:hypothetical protein